MAPRPKWHLWHCSFAGCDHVQLLEVMPSGAEHRHMTSATRWRDVPMKFVRSFYTKTDADAAVRRLVEKVRVAA